jgi:hypothetical protein
MREADLFWLLVGKSITEKRLKDNNRVLSWFFLELSFR